MRTSFPIDTDANHSTWKEFPTDLSHRLHNLSAFTFHLSVSYAYVLLSKKNNKQRPYVLLYLCLKKETASLCTFVFMSKNIVSIHNKMINLTLAICVYNAEKYIKETLESVMAQTMQDFHLLIVNDCSTDSSVAVIEKFFTEHPRQYEIVTIEKNGGIAKARNFAISYATTKYFLFIDSDDLSEPTLVEKEYVAITSDSDLIGVSCWNDFIDAKSQKVHGGTFLGEKSKENFIEKANKKKLIFLPIHTMFNREYAIKAGNICITGFPEGKPRYQDFCEELDMWTRMSDFHTEGKAIIALPEVLYHYRKMDGLSSNHFNMILKMRYTKKNLLLRRSGKKELTFIEFYESLSAKEIKGLKKDALAADALRNGVFYLKHKNVLKAAWEIMKSICYRPGYIFDKLKHNFFKKK